MPRIVIILISIYILYRVFFRFILPYIARYFFNKAAKSMQSRTFTYNHQPTERRAEGEIRIEQPEPTSKQKDDGEFTDYEEVK